jgi:hypothetical protein
VRVIVKLDHLGVGYGCSLVLDVANRGGDRRFAVGNGLARVVRYLARLGQWHVRVTAEGQPLDLASDLVPVHEREGLHAFRRDPDAETRTGCVPDRVLGGAGLVGADGGVGELHSHGCRLSLLLALANKVAK